MDVSRDHGRGRGRDRRETEPFCANRFFRDAFKERKSRAGKLSTEVHIYEGPRQGQAEQPSLKKELHQTRSTLLGEPL